MVRERVERGKHNRGNLWNVEIRDFALDPPEKLSFKAKIKGRMCLFYCNDISPNIYLLSLSLSAISLAINSVISVAIK